MKLLCALAAWIVFWLCVGAGLWIYMAAQPSYPEQPWFVVAFAFLLSVAPILVLGE
jgi:hypothetical protein